MICLNFMIVGFFYNRINKFGVNNFIVGKGLL